MSDKLNEIMAWKRREIAPLRRAVSVAELTRLDGLRPRPPSFAGALRRADGRLAVIAEIKRRSPSAGEIKAGATALDEARRFQAAGADALSVLTDEKYFGGQLDDLRTIASHFESDRPNDPSSPPLPCLRKDFMIHPIQVVQAREAGAAAILIIVRTLTDDEIRPLTEAAAAAGLDVLFEVHDEPELERALSHEARLIGVNNRDLKVFRTNLALSERLLPKIPPGITAISESGILTGNDAARAHAAGAHAVLVGEALMRAADPRATIAEFRAQG